jgi:hypothetical protein
VDPIYPQLRNRQQSSGKFDKVYAFFRQQISTKHENLRYRLGIEELPNFRKCKEISVHRRHFSVQCAAFSKIHIDNRKSNAPSVSTTPVANLQPMSTIPVANFATGTEI